MNNQIWTSIEELGDTVCSGYSVTNPENILNQYLAQVRQYPLYTEWFDRIEKFILELNKQVNVLEYGPGPGILAQRLITVHLIEKYTTVEPEKLFRNMVSRRTGNKANVINETAETYIRPCSSDIVVMTATYHHFHDKLKAMRNVCTNLRPGGYVLIGDAFIPQYEFDDSYNPVRKDEFLKKIIDYASAQILAMPNPKKNDIADQIRTMILDVLRIEELKVCVQITLSQLQKAGFEQISSTLMKLNNPNIDDRDLGYYFITAKKPQVSQITTPNTALTAYPTP